MRTPVAAVLMSALLGGALGVSFAWSQTIDPAKAQAWLDKTFGIKSERVVEATPDQLVTLRTIEPRPPSDFRVIAHYENFSASDPLTPPSADEEYFINCPSRRFHVDRIESFSENGARGAQSTSFGPSVWGKAVPRSPEDRIVDSVCGQTAPQAEVPAQPAAAPAPAVEAARSAPLPPPAQLPMVPAIASPKPGSVPAASAPRPVDKPGTVRVQLFAGDRTAAQRFIDGLPARLPAAAKVGKPELVEVASGGRPLFRVQIGGFASAAAAARFCSAAKAAGQECFVPAQARP